MSSSSQVDGQDTKPTGLRSERVAIGVMPQEEEEAVNRNAGTVYELDPLRDHRWQEFLRGHPRASVFHTVGWLEALRCTYAYEPAVLTTSPPDRPLKDGLVFCRVSSWLTGRRLVSLPISDHCEPLVDDHEDLACLLNWLEHQFITHKCRRIEIRPLTPILKLAAPDGFRVSSDFCFHSLNLQPSLDQLFRGFHKSCVQRKIQRAEREQLTYEHGRSAELISKFYKLFLLTRRRQQLPPQPLQWYRNLVDSLGDDLQIRVVAKDGRPVAAILTLSYKSTMVYKYGCSDPAFSNLGGTMLLFWKVIQEAKEKGLAELDLGRSDPDNSGLIKFKDHLGATRSALTYYSSPGKDHGLTDRAKGSNTSGRLIKYLPDRILTIAGKVLYRHFG